MLDLDKEMTELSKSGFKKPPSIAKLAKLTAASLDRALSHKAFEIFRDKRFRDLIQFEKLEQVEQDRIFNELILAGITLFILTVEAPDLRAEGKMKEYYFLLKEEIPKAHIEELRRLGIGKEFLEDWKKLTKMRYDEYSQDKSGIREAAMQMESRENELAVKDLEDINILLPLQAAIFGCFHHICRGKTEGKEELLRYLMRYFGRFYVLTRALIEGNKITLFKRLKVGLRHFLIDHKLYK